MFMPYFKIVGIITYFYWFNVLLELCTHLHMYSKLGESESI